MTDPTPSRPQVTLGRITLSDSKEAEKLAGGLDAHFQSVNDQLELQ